MQMECRGWSSSINTIPQPVRSPWRFLLPRQSINNRRWGGNLIHTTSELRERVIVLQRASPLGSLSRADGGHTHAAAQQRIDKLHKMSRTSTKLIVHTQVICSVAHGVCYRRGRSVCVCVCVRYGWDVETSLCSQEETQSRVLSR